MSQLKLSLVSQFRHPARPYSISAGLLIATKHPMITFLLSFLVSLSFQPVQAQTLSCEKSAQLKMSDKELNPLTEKICSPHFGPDPDEYLHYESDIKDLKAHQRLVYEYTYYCSAKLNSEMRKSSGHEPRILNLSKQLDIALCEHPSYQGETFRGVDLPKDILQQYLSSSEITFPSFTSTSKKHHIGCQFAGNTVFKIHSKNGKEVIKQSKHESEDEVLFRLNSKFKVLFVATGHQAQILAQCKEKPVQAFLELEEVE